MKQILILTTFFLFNLCVAAQEDTELFFQRDADLETKALLHKYLITTDSAELKINDLLNQVDLDGEFISSINKLQIAFVLENYAPQNTLTSFYLNRRMGFMIAGLNARYAQFFIKKAIHIAYALKEKGVEKRLELMGNMAGFHIQLDEPDSALYWYHRSVAEARGVNPIGYASALNNTGIFYSRTGVYDSAMVYYQLALKSLGHNIYPDTILYCSIRDNIAQEHERWQDYRFALDIYRFNDQVYTQLKRAHRIVLNKIKLLNAWRKFGQSNIDVEIESLAAYIGDHQKELINHRLSELEFYQFAKDYFYETHQTEKAKHYDQLYIALRDRIEKTNKEKMDLIVGAFLNIEATRFKKELDLYRTRAEAAQLKIEAANQSLRYNRRIAAILILTGAIIFVLMALYLRKRKQEFETTRSLTITKLREKELEAKTIQQELELKKKDLTNVVLQNSNLFDHDQKIIGRLSEIMRQKDGMEKGIHSLIADINTKSQTSDRALVIQHNIEQINTAFYDKLKSRFPALSKSEIELCGYLRIGLSNKDIALLKNVEYTSIKVSKTRLRKKLGITLEEDLSRFVQSI